MKSYKWLNEFIDEGNIVFMHVQAYEFVIVLKRQSFL